MSTRNLRKQFALLFPMAIATAVLSGCGQVPRGATTVQSAGVTNTPITYTSPQTSTTNGTVVSGASSSNPPTIASGAQNGSTNTISLGTALTLVAPFAADASLTYQWYKNGSKLTTATASQLDLTSMTSTDYGVYTVTATNSQGSLTSAPFIVNPILMMATLGSHDCNGAQCNNDAGTATKVCQQRFGSQSVMANSYGFGPSGVKWTTQFCSWTGTTWSCNWNCTYNCNGNNVLGYVYCLQ